MIFWQKNQSYRRVVQKFHCSRNFGAEKRQRYRILRGNLIGYLELLFKEMLHLRLLGFILFISGTLALYDSNSDVVELTPSNFDRLVTKSDEVWIVEFFAPWCGHCKNLVPEYSKAARALKGIAKVGAVDADNFKELAQKYGVTGFPTIKMFTGSKHTPYQGQRSAEAFVDSALKAAKDKAYENLGKKAKSSDKSDVITLTDDNFKQLVLDSEDMWLVEFYAPWCGHCKNLEPHWAKAASELKGKVKVGAVDATVHQAYASTYQVQGYPTIKYFPSGKKNNAEEYNGGRTSGDIVAWALEKLAENVAAPDVVQVTDQDTMSQCSEKPLCVVSVLPHILDCDAVCRNSYIDVLRRLGEKYKNKMWGWVWSEAGAQGSLESSLEMGGFGYPAMAVVNAKKLKFSTLRGSFSETGINEFLRDLSFGRGQTAPVRGAEMPKIVTTDPWDGKDGEMPLEEDIDLSDVDLEKDEL